MIQYQKQKSGWYRKRMSVSYNKRIDPCRFVSPSSVFLHVIIYFIKIIYQMNFLKEAVNKLNDYGNMTHQKNWMPGSSDHITQLIKTCSYTDDVKFVIEKSVRQILEIYGTFKVDKLQFSENGYMKRFIELIGELQVNNFKIQTHIMYPTGYPKSPPFIRIINPNINVYICTQYYKTFQSANDPKSYVLNPMLQSVKTWQANSQVVHIILETNTLIQKNYPFMAINQQQQQQQPVNAWSNMNNNQYQNMNNGHNMAKQPPIAFKQGGHNANECLAKAQAFVITQKKKLAQIQVKHGPNLSNIQNLQSAKYSLESESLYINKENYKMKTFADSTDISNVELTQVIVPADELSKQILDLITSIRAKQDTVNFLETKFNEEKISLEDFIKNARKLEEAKFQEKALLQKCRKSSEAFH